ncbi:MAG TPA: tRNA uridine-5-carboxymethylaminomethyl(34) synthesis GTPase MnmE [Chthoniobacterales bacterium]|nr:tRNA uridine-5-carboxymethylaminomethyl(34) synthesis GTPase MnmE [Chthoniobacterales bacterium]
MHFSVEREPNRKPAALNSGELASPIDSDTIAAISTAPGEAAISLIRISGADAVKIADRIFNGSNKPSGFAANTQHVGEIRDGGQLVDQVVLSVHRAPASYTGEDLIEITCHGGVLVTARVLECCLRAGARAARPGEFTERAFLNGKMDLTQAEAVIDLIRAKTDLALRSATEQLEGRLGKRIRDIRDELVSLVANIEAAIDFPEEGIQPADNKNLTGRLESITRKISDLLDTADQGRILREGVRVVIYGATNAGKSSLLNRLLGHERVIVSETHGTTRDTIEEAVNLNGFPIRLTDTAGLRDAADQLEREGMARTEKSIQQADLRLQVVDASVSRPGQFRVSDGPGRELLVLNKADLPEHPDWRGIDAVRISCLTGAGIAELQQEIVMQIGAGNLQPDSTLAVNARHRESLRRALEACDKARQLLDQRTPPEYVAVDLTSALRSLGEIIGLVDVEQVLDSVFSQFCIGK